MSGGKNFFLGKTEPPIQFLSQIDQPDIGNSIFGLTFINDQEKPPIKKPNH